MKNLRTLVKDLNIRSIKDLIQAKLDNKLPDLEFHFSEDGNLEYVRGYYKRLEILKTYYETLCEVTDKNIPKRELAIKLVNKLIDENNIKSKPRLIEHIVRVGDSLCYKENWYNACIEMDSSLKVTRIFFIEEYDEDHIEYEVPFEHLDSVLKYKGKIVI